MLILGSMPGKASLVADEYYAHPRNAFWTIMGALFGAGPQLPYPKRVDRLLANGIAVWDVLAQCERPGSLDAAIVGGSEKVNDLPGLIAQLPRLHRVCFNGATAETYFRRLIVPRPNLDYRRLPSTSPAHAALRPEEKLALWRAALLP